jgi:hypothetical protein
MQSTGCSKSWTQQQQNVIRIFDDKFRQSSNDLKQLPPFEQLPEASLRDEHLYAQFALFSTEEYKIEGGTHHGNFLSCDTVLNYFSSLINQAASLCKATGDDATKLFFSCLEAKASTPSAKWLQGVKHNIVRTLFQRAMESGEEMDKSAAPIFLVHVQLMCAAYAREGSAQAALRKIALLTAWQSAGRSAESSWISFKGMYWCENYKCVFTKVPQTKVCKVKIIAFMAGRNRHCCWFLHFADYLTSKALPVYEESVASWLLPALRVEKPGTHTHTHHHQHSHLTSLSLSLSLSRTHTHTLFTSRTHTHTHTHPQP